MSVSRLPLSAAWRLIFISVLCISVPAWLVWLGVYQWRSVRGKNPKYHIERIIQTGPEKEALKTVFLAELLHLSQDHPTNLYRFNTRLAQERLKTCPVIETATVKKMTPNTLFIDYTVRHPVARLVDYSNTAVDKEGYLFPLHPFFTPKRLPEIYLGLPPFGSGEEAGKWNKPLSGQQVDLAFDLLKLWSEHYREYFRMMRIDVAHAFAESYGQRQIVLIVEDQQHRQEGKQLITYLFPRILRLSTRGYREELNDYLKLREQLLEKGLLQQRQVRVAGQTVVKMKATIIDLRIPDVAYIRY